MRSTFREYFWLFRCASWPLVAGLLIVMIAVVSHAIRNYAFDNFCNQEVRHVLDAGEPGVYADWCDAWWWHHLRALSRLIPGIVGGFALYWLCGAYLRRSSTGYRFTAIGLTVIPVVQLVFVVLDPFKDWFSKSCFWRGTSNVDECINQLGPYGDQRFYIPVLLPLVFWSLYCLRRRPTIPVVMAAEKRNTTLQFILRSALFFGIIGGFIGSVFITSYSYQLADETPLALLLARAVTVFCFFSCPLAGFAGATYSVLRLFTNSVEECSWLRRFCLGLATAAFLVGLWFWPSNHFETKSIALPVLVDLWGSKVQIFVFLGCTLVTVYLHSLAEQAYDFFSANDQQ